MRKTMADAICKAYGEFVVKNIPDDLPDGTNIPLLVNFKLGDLRALELQMAQVDANLPPLNAA